MPNKEQLENLVLSLQGITRKNGDDLVAVNKEAREITTTGKGEQYEPSSRAVGGKP